MAESTAIAWTDHTFNPWWGCERVSPGCQHCYAEAFAKRVGHGGSKPAIWGRQAERRFFGDKHWAEPLKWGRAAAEAGRPALVFCASMADVFEGRPELMGERARLADLIAATPNLIWLLLTKRPENVVPMAGRLGWVGDSMSEWPSNVWIGTTVEDQRRADERLPYLAEIPAPVRFLSMEPLLEGVRLSAWMLGAVQWVIVGGESGPGHRPFDDAWARWIRADCALAQVPFFFKQHGGHTAKAGGHLLDGEIIQQFPAAAMR